MSVATETSFSLAIPSRQIDANTPERMSDFDYEKYILQGGQLIVQGKYKDAVTHFRNHQVAHQAGLTLRLGRQKWFDTRPTTKEINFNANWIAMNCWCNHGIEIILSGAIVIKSGRLQVSLPPELFLNIALVHMEEWLHALQHKKNTSLAGYPDDEVDIAAYMLQHNIPVTPQFMARYGRALVLYNEEGIDDSLSQTPALRKGRYCQVERSNGQVEENWQIFRFNHRKGLIIVTNGTEIKSISRSEFARINQVGVYPYTEARSFLHLFQILDRYEIIVGSKLVYSNKKIKGLINQVRQGKISIETIPQAGGLRLKVHDLLKDQ